MAQVATVGSAGSTLGGGVMLSQPVPAPVLGSGAWRQAPYLTVSTDDDEPVPYVMDATIIYGLDLTVATATVTCSQDPGLPNNTWINVTAGAGLFNQLRFRGLFRRRRVALWPHTFTMQLTGSLSLAARFQQAAGLGIPSFINERLPVTGLSLFQLLGSQDTPAAETNRRAFLTGQPANDQNIVLAVLTRVPDLIVDPADIGGTGHVFGSLAWRQLSWTPGQTALAYIQNLDKVCLGYRTFETLGGRVVRRQAFGYPTGDAAWSFTEGVDIWDASGDRSIEQLINSAYVEGYAIGGKPGIISGSTIGLQGNDFQPANQPYLDTFNSPLIEDTDFAQQVAEWRTTEGNRELVEVSLVTFMDYPIEPASTIAVNFPHAGVTEPVWVQRVEIRVSPQPVLFQQNIGGFGGGVAA